MTQFNLSARAYHLILKLARTVADLAGGEDIQAVHLAEALQYHPSICRAGEFHTVYFAFLISSYQIQSRTQHFK